MELVEPRHAELSARVRAQALSVEPTGAVWTDAELAARVRALDLYRYLVPREQGGAVERFEVGPICAIRVALAYRSAAADSVFAVQGLGSYPVLRFGSDEQRRALLPGVADGSALFAFALTEADAGSDVAALSTRALRSGDGYVLDGAKRFISNAGIATHYSVFARTADGAKGLSAFVVPADTPGFRLARRMEMMGEHPIGELAFERCRVPLSARLGNEGDGMKIALATLDVFRTTVGAAAVGMAHRALDEALAYSQNRRQFGAPLAALASVQNLLADSAVELEAARLLVREAARIKDAGAERVTYEAAIAKLFSTEAASRIIDRCLQIHGGNGVIKGAVIERLYRDIRALRIYEGASEVQRLVIARQLLAPMPT